MPRLNSPQSLYGVCVRFEAINEPVMIAAQQEQIVETLPSVVSHACVVARSIVLLAGDVRDIGLYLLPGRISQAFFASGIGAGVAREREESLYRGKPWTIHGDQGIPRARSANGDSRFR